MASKHSLSTKPRREPDEYQPEHEGDVLGLGDANPNVDIPQHKRPGGGPPQGIDVRDHATGIGDLSQTPGATGIDMGGGGEGTGVTQQSSRPKSAKLEETE